MTSAAMPAAAPASTEAKEADVFVVFGITGDLAKVMTFHSLYRLEQRGLLECPIVGVAVDDWTIDQLVQRARDSIVGTGRAARRGGVRALRGAALVRPGRLRRRRRVRARREGDRRRDEPGLLPRDPAVPLRSGRPGPRGGRPDEERADRRREAVRPRRRVRARARRGAPPVHRGVAALSASTTTSGRWASRRSSTSGSRTGSSSRSGTGSTSSVSRSRWRRTSASRTAATSTIPSARCATSSSTT